MLDRYGFKRKNYAELLAETEERAKQLFGNDVNTTEKSPIGILLRLFVWFLAKGHELAEKVYNSGNPTKAEGVQLDDLAVFYNTSRQPQQAATVTLSFTGTPNFTILEGTRFETESRIDFALTGNVVLDGSGNGTGEAVCLTVGVLGNVDANTIINQSEPNADITTVTNPTKATGGREEETDSELKKRLLSSRSGQGSGTTDAILSAVSNLQGVRATNIDVNRSAVEVNGLPPHSFQVYVLGGESQEIGEAIFSEMTGVEAFGTTQVNVQDVSGNTHVVSYTPATIATIYSTVNLTTDNAFPVNGADLVKDAIVSVIGGEASDGTLYTGLNMGETVIYSKLLLSVMSIQGVTDASLTIGKTVESQSSANITVERFEVAQINAADITVVIA